LSENGKLAKNIVEQAARFGRFEIERDKSQ
jgi:hypothetical protein